MAKLRIALVGCGQYAGAHAMRLAAHPDAEVVACVDVRDDIVHGFIHRHLSSPPAGSHRPKAYIDLGQMLHHAKPDAAVIATPHTLHLEHAMAALDAGCHVFLEKPMVTHANDAYALRDKVQRTGRVLIVGYNTPSTPEFRYLRDVIAHPDGANGLGDLEIINGYLSQNWMRWTNGTWRQDPTLSGGGMAYDSGAHILNSLCWSVGHHVAEVFAFVDHRGCKVDVNAAINIRFKNGVLATLTIAGNCPSDGSHMAFCFAGGRVEIDGWYGSWINIHNAYGRVKYPPIAGPNQTPDDNFIDAIRGRAEPLVTVEHGVIQCELMDAIYESAKTGRPVRI